MIPILYESNETAFTSNGLGRLRDCIDFQVSEERNGVYEAVFQYPVDGANFEKIQPGRIVAARHDDSGDVQPFDIVAYSKPLDGVVTFHAVHVSYRLAGQVVYSRNINSLTAALNLLGNVSGTLFTFSADFTRSGYMAAADGVPRTARQMLGGIEGSILDTYGGELEFNRWQVILHRARGVTRPFTIRYGVNMLDYQDDTDYSETYNSAVPYWAGQDTVVVGSRVDSGAATYAGRRIVAPLDLTDKFEEKPTATQLQNMAASVMAARQPSLPQQTIKVDFVRLQDLDNYAGFADLLQCNLCDTINVSFPRYNMTGAFKIVKTEYDVLEERYTAMELGTLSTTLAEALGISSGGGLVSSGGSSGGVADVMMNGASIVDTDGIAMVTDAAGNLKLNGALTLQNAKNILAKDTGNTERAILSMSGNNNTVLGYGGYDASQGGTNIYGDTVRLYSNNPIVTNQPFAALFKVTTVTVSVAALSAHASVAASSHTMTAQSGYNAVGIVGWSSGSYRIRPTTHYIASNTSLYAGFANTSGGATSQAYNVVFYVLWLKATSG